MGRFETERLATEANLAVLTDLFPREYGYTDVIEYGPLTAEWVTLLCDDCYDSSEDGMRTAYEAWATDA
jgi:hypothetical protein